jgi:hypothetical protein
MGRCFASFSEEELKNRDRHPRIGGPYVEQLTRGLRGTGKVSCLPMQYRSVPAVLSAPYTTQTDK